MQYSFELFKAFSENPFSVEENSDFIINKIFIKLLNLTNKLNDEYRRFPLNICANILTVLLEDEKLSYLNQLKKIQISKEETFNHLITKIIRAINYEVELIKGKELIDYEIQRKMKFQMIIPDFIEQEKGER